MSELELLKKIKGSTINGEISYPYDVFKSDFGKLNDNKDNKLIFEKKEGLIFEKKEGERVEIVEG